MKENNSSTPPNPLVNLHNNGAVILLDTAHLEALRIALGRACSTWEKAPKWIAQLSDALHPEGPPKDATYSHWDGQSLVLIDNRNRQE